MASTSWSGRPLPLPRYARVSILGEDEGADALHALMLAGGRNASRVLDAAALDSDVVFLTSGPAYLREHELPLARQLAGRVAVICATCVYRDADGYAMRCAASQAAEAASKWPHVRVVGGLQQFTAQHFALAELGLLSSDAPVVGDDREAADLVEGIIDELPGFTAVYAGGMRTASAVEALAAIVREVSSANGGPVGFRLDAARGLRFIH